jgi:hypothetical protein
MQGHREGDSLLKCSSVMQETCNCGRKLTLRYLGPFRRLELDLRTIIVQPPGPLSLTDLEFGYY